ncbi:MAG: cupin domain-containing protein [Solirubrobacterales bacterium]
MTERPNIFEPVLEFDEADPEGYRAGMDRMGPRVGGARLGASVYELPPGQSICPYHYEHGEEEWLIAISGRPILRTPEGESELAPGDVVCFRRGPTGAHKVTNRTEEVARVLMFSDVTHPAVSVYPDSDKIGVYTDPARTDNVIVKRSSGVEYYEGEA